MNGKVILYLSLLSVCGGLCGQAVAANPSGYGVSQSNNLIFVKTPWGSSIYLGPVGFDSLPSYAFEVPLSDFRSSVNRSAPAAAVADANAPGPTALGDESSLIAEANRLYNKGEFDHALRFVDEVSRRNPKNIRAWVMKGSLMHVLGHKDLARQSWQKALELDPSNVPLANVLKEMK